jgi:hypothetical protein
MHKQADAGLGPSTENATNRTGLKTMKRIFNRIYSDYMMPSRLDQHEKILVAALNAGYTPTSLRDFSRLLKTGAVPADKIILHRHDIDTDVRTARRLFQLEKKYNVKSSYYFRLCTLDVDLMNEIEEYGSEASYHYEELATFAKKHNIKDPDVMRQRLPEIREHFVRNFQVLERQFGRKMVTVASHGDFANRRLKLANTEILSCPALRRDCGIECEAYDEDLLAHFNVYISDRPHPQYYYPIAPLDAIRRHSRVYLLTHPRQFDTNWKENTKSNLVRFYEGLTW